MRPVRSNISIDIDFNGTDSSYIRQTMSIHRTHPYSINRAWCDIVREWSDGTKVAWQQNNSQPSSQNSEKRDRNLVDGQRLDRWKWCCTIKPIDWNNSPGRIHCCLRLLLLLHRCCLQLIWKAFRLCRCFWIGFFFFALHALQLVVIISVHLEGDPCRAVAPIENSLLFFFLPPIFTLKKNSCLVQNVICLLQYKLFCPKTSSLLQPGLHQEWEILALKAFGGSVFPSHKTECFVPTAVLGCIRSPFNFH